MELVMAGLEAFLAHELKAKKSSIETIGHLWGYRRTVDNRTLHVVEHVSTSILAKRRADSVTNEPGVARLKSAVAEYMRPELCFLGDFHTHPYTTQAEVNHHQGWQFSDADQECLLSDKLAWHLAADAPLMIVLAICRMQKVHHNEPLTKRQHVQRFDIAEFRMWLAGYIGQTVQGKRSVPGQSHSPVRVAPIATEVWHGSGERLEHYTSDPYGT
jgi:hypothetical protein